MCSVTGVSEHCGDTLPSVEVKDADVFIGAACGHVLTRRIELNLPGQKSSLVNRLYIQEVKACGSEDRGGKCYPEQTAILTQ